MTENDGKKRIRPEDLGSNADELKPKEVEGDGESFLNKVIGDEKFIFAEAELQDEEKAQGVTLDTAHRSGNQQLIFDRETIDKGERASLEEFIRLIRSSGKEALKGTKYEWFFDEEGDEFLEDLAELMERRLQELNEGKSKSSLHSMGFSQKLVTAMESFREMTYRSTLKEGINKQVNKVPIIGFQAKRRGQDGVVNLRFNPNNISDPTNEVEALYVNNPSGEKELIFSCKDPNAYETIRPILKADDPNKFGIVDESFTSITDVDSSTGQDFSRFEFVVKKREGQVEPLFTKVKVLKKPINLDNELDKYLEEKRAEAEKKRQEEARRQQQQQYQPTPPSVPSTPQHRWQQQPQTYSRSG